METFYRRLWWNLSRWNRWLFEHFKKFELELTADTDAYRIDGTNKQQEKEVKEITFLDIDIFITIFTRKNTAKKPQQHHTLTTHSKES